MSKDELYKLLVSVLKGIKTLNGVDFYTDSTDFKRVTWFQGEPIKITDNYTHISIDGNTGTLHIFANEIDHVELYSKIDGYIEVKITCIDYSQYIIRGS